MVKRIILATFCLTLLVTCFSEVARSSEVISECSEQLLQKYPSIEAIEEQFRDGAKWQEKTVPSPHDSNLELHIKTMEYPGISIGTLEYTSDDEYRYFIISVDVEKAGFVDFLGIDIGSTAGDVKKIFGEPQQIEGNMLAYEDDNGFYLICFIIENNKVKEMKFRTFLD
ncbi:MAG: hypothetical protein FWE49_06240 [Synergistaceae bacterium]|nr:hypothetical protein [Synergistaceae bacterium]